jgi:hypothetical protein
MKILGCPLVGAILTISSSDALFNSDHCTTARRIRFERLGSNQACKGDNAMSLGLILVIILVIFLLGGFSGRFRGYGYGYGHGGIGTIGIILIIIVVLMLVGRL